MTVETKHELRVDQFSPEDRLMLIENGYLIVQFKGRSLFDFEKQGYRFVAFPQFLKNKERVFSEKSRSSEVAFIHTGIYLPDCYRHSSYEEQSQMLREEEEKLRQIGLKNITVVFPSVADAMEIADIEANKKNNIFGMEYGYLYTRTSTQNDSDSSVIIGCDDLDTLEITKEELLLYGQPDDRFRGIHVMDFPKANNKHAGLNLVLTVVPSI